MKRADKLFNPAQARVCSEHFVPDDYERDLRHELMGTPFRRRGSLKKDAIPSVNMPGSGANISVYYVPVDIYDCKFMTSMVVR